MAVATAAVRGTRTGMYTAVDPMPGRAAVRPVVNTASLPVPGTEVTSTNAHNRHRVVRTDWHGLESKNKIHRRTKKRCSTNSNKVERKTCGLLDRGKGVLLGRENSFKPIIGEVLKKQRPK